jgi:hypothetical protein
LILSNFFAALQTSPETYSGNGGGPGNNGQNESVSGVVDGIRTIDTSTEYFHVRVYHAAETFEAARSIVEYGIDPTRFRPNTRFGRGHYTALEQSTSVAERPTIWIITEEIQIPTRRLLNLTDASVRSAWGYEVGYGESYYPTSQNIAARAQASGFDAILFPSEQVAGGTNLVIFQNFGQYILEMTIVGGG